MSLTARPALRIPPAGDPTRLAGRVAAHLAGFGDRVALVGNGAGAGLSHAALADRVRDVAGRLGTARRLVMVELRRQRLREPSVGRDDDRLRRAPLLEQRVKLPAVHRLRED